ncbi:flagellar basal body-associated FliL family protein [Caldalkalibacillus salinus]|uniref:flagellar basal body-associated FliL family protein n=1 Tax=Caldalkalibacillus salinus TaxID=2803787 RepID=UPI001920E8FC|nr:flagellar basal body-associated FliL family protein [Caldalkalibacillus salinus]
MLNNKLFNMSLIIIVGMTLLGGIAFVLWKTTFETTAHGTDIQQPVQANELTADEVNAYSVRTEQITTNLASDDFIIVEFYVTMDGEESKDEFEKRIMEARAATISVLAGETPDTLRGEEGIDRLEAKLMQRYNEILHTGKVIRVQTIDRKIQ